ncbi:MAG: hypothetical protein BAJALOKI1v1_20011 [Promethearchaeota archaeon]|nr:MAG: hypothetical protein BAJALOKI1v1_20011 [Candidatus Lokiarchaeota archaeon]
MAEFFEKEMDNLESNHNPYKGLYEVFILYFDEEKGHIPLLLYSDEKIVQKPENMRPVFKHPIWFLDIDDISAQNHVDLEFKDKMYLARKFYAKSDREKRRCGIQKEAPETIVIILALPTKLIVFGGELIQKLTTKMIDGFGNHFCELIESEILRMSPIKTSEIKEKINNGDIIKRRMKNEIKEICNCYFSNVIKPEGAKSIKQQLQEFGINISQKIMAWLGLSVDPMKLKQIAEKLASYDNVIVAAITNGDHDLVVQLIADNEKSLHLFIEKIVKPIDGIDPTMDISISYIAGSKYLK